MFVKPSVSHSKMTITAENKLEYPQGQLFVHAIEEKAQWIPNNMYMRYAPDDWLHRGYKTITWKQYASAIDKMAFWFDERLGKAVDCETVAYFGPNDPRYAILIPSVVKHGRKVSVKSFGVTSRLTASVFANSRWTGDQRGACGLDCSK